MARIWQNILNNWRKKNMAYGIFESNNINGRNLSFVSTVDIENGQLLHRGELVTGSKDVFNAILPTAGSLADTPVFVAGDPAWNYTNYSALDQAEDAYIIPKGKVFRVYPLGNTKNVPDRFSVASYSIDFTGVTGAAPAVGQYVTAQVPVAASGTTGGKFYVASDAAPSGVGFVGKITRVTDMGYTYFVGTPVDTRVTKVFIEVVQNGTV
jgi:hypothetical protein